MRTSNITQVHTPIIFISVVVILGPPLSVEAEGNKSVSHVIISSFDQGPAGKDSGKEWVTLYNPADAEVDLKGWSFWTNYWGGRTVPIDQVVIPPKGYWTYVHPSGWLKNENLKIILKDAEDREMDKVSKINDGDNDNRFWKREPDLEWEFGLQELEEGVMRKGVVVGVVDGDTLDISPVEKAGVQRVRLVGIGAPEIETPEGKEVKKFVEKLCLGKKVNFDVDDRDQYDKYKRVVAVIYVDGLNLNRKLLEKGDVKSLIIPPSEFVPYASFAFSPQNPVAGQKIEFDASSSWTLDPNAAIVSYEWDFGDGMSKNGKIVTHSYPSAGKYNVNLKAMDSDGEERRENTKTKSITVNAKSKGEICGHVNLQGRINHSGAEVEANGFSTTTDSEGNFSLEVSPGTYTVKVTMPGYLTVEKTEVKVKAGETTTLPEANLLGGDADHNGDIDAADLARIADHFNTSDAASDINGDGIVDIYDLILVGKNFGKTSEED